MQDFESPIIDLWHLKGRVVDPSEGKYNMKKSAVNSYMRTIQKTPEVMVKITGGGIIYAQVAAHIDYISRNGKLPVHSYDGEYGEIELQEDLDSTKAILDSWVINERKGAGKYKQTQNIMLSMPQGTNPKKLQNAAEEFAKKIFKNHSFLYVVHTDKNHPHIHFCVDIASKKIRGKNIRITKKTLQNYREEFAKKLREHGLEANASPRVARGEVKKPQSIAAYHAVKRGASKVAKYKMQEAAQEVLQENKMGELINPLVDRLKEITAAVKVKEGSTPLAQEMLLALAKKDNGELFFTEKKKDTWIDKIIARRSNVLQTHLEVLQVLETQGKHQEAEKIKKYIQSFPTLETEKEAYKKEARTFYFERERKQFEKKIREVLAAPELQNIKLQNLDYKENNLDNRALFIQRRTHIKKLTDELKLLQQVQEKERENSVKRSLEPQNLKIENDKNIKKGIK